jgi:signal transduction histidine kinase
MDASSNGSLLGIRARETRMSRNGLAVVSIAIGDSGCGISDSAKGKLFSPFFTTKQSVGAGLGLWVTKGIVEKYGGSIRFRSRVRPPSGTVFRIVLPRRNEALDSEPMAGAKLATVPASGKQLPIRERTKGFRLHQIQTGRPSRAT